jgi:hypothetical protein
MANDFFQKSRAEGFPTKVDSEDVIRVYDSNTNTFGSYNPDGTTRTFFSLIRPYMAFQRTLIIGTPSQGPWGTPLPTP